jgi:hypothetical protein
MMMMEMVPKSFTRAILRTVAIPPVLKRHGFASVSQGPCRFPALERRTFSGIGPTLYLFDFAHRLARKPHTFRADAPGTFAQRFALRKDFNIRSREIMARKTSKSASKDVKRAMHKRKRGTLKSGRSGKTVKSRKQAIAIGLSEARSKGKKVAPKKSSRKRSKK